MASWGTPFPPTTSAPVAAQQAVLHKQVADLEAKVAVLEAALAGFLKHPFRALWRALAGGFAAW